MTFSCGQSLTDDYTALFVVLVRRITVGSLTCPIVMIDTSVFDVPRTTGSDLVGWQGRPPSRRICFTEDGL